MKSRGYSFVQLMISLAIGGLAISFAIIYMAQTSAKLTSSASLSEAEQALAQAQVLLQEDFPNNLFSPVCSTARYRGDNPTPAQGEFYAWWRTPFDSFDPSDSFDNLNYFRYVDNQQRNSTAWFVEIGEDLYFEYLLADQSFDPVASAQNLSASEDGFIYFAIQKSTYFSLYDDQCRHLVQKNPGDSPSGRVRCQNDGTQWCVRLRLQKPLNYNSHRQEFVGGRFEFAPLEKVTLMVDEARLVPTIVKRFDDKSETDQIILSGVSKFHIHLGGFQDRWEDQNFFVPLDPVTQKTMAYRSVLDESYLSIFQSSGGNKNKITPPLATWARFEIERVGHNSNQQTSNQQASTTWNFAVALKMHAMEDLMTIDGAVPPICSRITRARCRAECSFLFTNTNPQHEFFSGYGDPNGPLCGCGRRDAAGDWIHPDQGAGNYPRWNDGNDSDKARLNACARQYRCGFNSNAPAWLRDKHPGCMLVSECMQPRDGLFDPNAQEPFDVSELKQIIENSTQPENSARLRCDWVGLNWQGAHQSCFLLAQQFLGSGSSWTISDNPWKNTCRCRLENKGPDPGPSSSPNYNQNDNQMINYRQRTLDFHAIDWDSVCGITTSSCPAWNSSKGAYNITTDSDPKNSREDQFLTVEEATLCECRKRAQALASAHSENAQFYVAKHGDTSYQDRIHIRDQRSATVDPIVGNPPNAQACGSAPQAAGQNFCYSNVGARVTVKVIKGGEELTLQNMNCARAQCSTGHMATQEHGVPGCCLPDGHIDVYGNAIPWPEWTNYVNSMGLQGAALTDLLNNPYRFYCHPRCQRYNSDFNDRERWNVERSLVGVLDDWASGPNRVGRCVVRSVGGQPVPPGNSAPVGGATGL